MKEELVKKYKNDYESDNIDICVLDLLHLMINFDSSIKHGEEYDFDLKHLLFNTNSIKNPMGMKYTVNDYDKTIRILHNAFKNIKTMKLNIDERIIRDIISLIIYTECFYKMNSINSQRMDDSEFGKVSLEEQLMMLLIYYQDQLSLNLENISKENYITGMELSITNKQLKYNRNVNTSLTDSFESILESMNEIIHYLYYRFAKQMKQKIKIEDLQIDYIKIYDEFDLEKYILIAFQRFFLRHMEEGTRYGYYIPNKGKKNGMDFYGFLLENENRYIARRIGILRREYQVRKNSLIISTNAINTKKTQRILEILSDKLIDTQQTSQLMFDFSKFFPNKRHFQELEKITNIKVETEKFLTKSYYLNCSVQDVKIEDLLTTYLYLNTLSIILFHSAEEYVNREKQKIYIKELGIVDISYLIKELSRLHNFKLEYSKKLIDKFVFHETNNKNDDIFSQPLIKISKEQILLSFGLVEQVNLDRLIERQFIIYDKDISKIGHKFEKNFIEQLSISSKKNSISNFRVNTNEVRYRAYDGREIEFDVISTLGDYLILTELKSMMTSYDINELKKRERNIRDAMAQLIRRKKSVKKDWKIIKELVSIDLPEQPYDEDHIILIACTDAYDFTPTRKKGVFITDDSTYLKYFTNPNLNLIEYDNESVKIEKIKSLWKKGYPDPIEFLEYLMNPISTSFFKKDIKKEYVSMPLFDKKDSLIYCEEYMLIRDPMNKFIKN